MVSAIPLCLLVVAVSVVSSQEFFSDSEPSVPTSERRTFKHGKPVKVLPLIKKHKKFAGLLPLGLAKGHFAQVPVIHEAPARPIYKIHRYQGIEFKPVSDVSIPAPTPIVESHPVVHSSDFEPSFSPQPEFSAPPPPSNFVLYPFNEKPIFSAPAIASPPPSLPPPPVFASLPPPSPVFSYVPAPQPAPVLPSFPVHLPPVTIQSGPVLPSISIVKPSPAPIIASVPTAPQQAPPNLTPLPAPLPPSFVFSSPPPVFPSIPVKIPAPTLPPVPSPSPAPAFSSISVVSPPAPSFSAIPSPSPAPVIASLPALPSPAPILSISVPEPEFPYPPSGTPIPSYIKDISLPEISVTEPTPTKVVTPNYEEVTVGTTIVDGSSKNFGHVLGAIKGENGLLQKLKGWKAEKANAALNHLAQFKKPIAISHPPVVAPSLPLSQVPVQPSLQFPGPSRPLPLTPDFRPPPVFLPQTQFFPLGKYENFPPNNIEPPPLFNSYGVPIPYDSYAPIGHGSHDRLSPDASEEEPSILPPPPAFGEQKQEQSLKEVKQQLPDIQQQNSQIRQNFQPQFQPQIIVPQDQPIYIPEDSKTVKEEIKTAEEIQPVRNIQPEETLSSEEPEDPNLQNHRINHKE